jgi:hypothetical protein
MMPMTSTTRSLDARGLTQRQRWPKAARTLDGHKATWPFLDVPARVASTGVAWSLLGWYRDEGKCLHWRTRNAAGVLLVIAGGRSYQLGLVARGIVLVRLVLVALSSGSARLRNSSSSMRGRERLLPPRR